MKGFPSIDLFYEGDIAEAIVFDKELNEAERIAAENYLASKYGLSSSLNRDKFAHDSGYGNDVAGIGQAYDGSIQSTAYSSLLRLTNPGSTSNSEFLFYGHDGASAASWTNTESPSTDFQRIEREWKFDETGGDIGTVTLEVDTTKLPSKPSGYTNYYAILSTDNDFSTQGDQNRIELTNVNGSVRSATVNVQDDKHLTYAVGSPAATPQNVAAQSDLNRRIEMTFDEVTTNKAGLSTTLTGDEYLVYIDSRDNSGFSFSDATQLTRTTDYSISVSSGTVTAGVTQDQSEDNGTGTTDIDNNTDYALWVTAKNEVDESAKSSQVTATPALKVFFQTASSTGSEKDDADKFKVELSDTHDQDVSVDLAIAPDGQSPFDGTSLRSVSSIDNIDSGGSSYSVGDIIGEDDGGDGGSGLQIKVTSVDGSGAVTGADTEIGGSGYTSAPTSFTTLSGSGSGADFSLSLQSSASDYNLKTTTATVNSGNLTTTLDNGDLKFNDDTVPENTETVELTISNPSTSGATATLGSQTAHDVDINDNDLSRKVYLTDNIGTNDDGATSEKENTSISYTLELNNSDPVNDTKVEWRIDTGAGTAEDSDFSTLSGTETIKAGDSSTSFTLPVSGDSEFEDNETADVNLVGAENANLDNSKSDRFTTLTHTIENDDSAPVVSFKNTTSSDTETDQSLSITVQLDRKSNEDITVDLSTSGTAIGGGTDYAFSTSSVTISAGNTSTTLAPDIKEDALDENGETLEITLSSVSSGSATIGTDDTHTHTISDDDSPPTVSFANTAASAKEDAAGTQNVEVTLSEKSGRDVTVDYSKAGTATESNDYTDDDDGSITFSTSGGESSTTSKNITLTIKADQKGEDDETIDLGFSSSSITNGDAGSTTAFTFTIVNDDLGIVGPAGVGSATTNPLWVRADSGITTSSGSSVSGWSDLSGNANDATAPSGSAEPTLNGSDINGEPSLTFDGNDDVLEGNSVLAGGKTGRTVIAVYDPNNRTDEKILALNYSNEKNGVSNGFAYTVTPEIGIRVGGASKIYKTQPGKNAYHITTYRNGRGEKVSSSDTFLDGTLLTRTDNTSDATIDVQGSDYAIGDLNPSGFDTFYDGEIAEIIAYSQELNEAQRTIVENYLDTRYGLGVVGTGDTPDIYAGTFTKQLFGIGQESDGSHPAAAKAGLRLDINTGFENGDYVMAGHDTPSNSTTFDTGNLPSGIEARMTRNWELDATDASNVARADFTFDLSDAGLNGPAGTAGDYKLLKRGTTSGSWSSLGSATSVSGDKITFSGFAVNDGFYTVASSDTTNSPIDNDGLALVIDGEAGADEVDEGWRYLGMPTTGASAGDLKQSDGTQFINYSYKMAYTWNDADSSWTAVTSDVALPEGRGYLVWIFDQTNAYPVDPSITMKLPTSFSAPGDTTIKVGDGTPSADAALSTSVDDRHLLSNPYGVPYDLSALGTPGSDDFTDEVQIWEHNSTLDGNDPSGADDSNVGTYVKRSRSQGEKIAAWQGFWLFRSGTSSSKVTFDKAGRTPGAAPGFVGSKSQTKTDVHQVNLKVVARNEEGTPVALDKASSVAFASGATEGLDYFDTPKLEPQTSTYAVAGPVGPTGDGPKMKAQESRPLPNDPVEVPLGFDAQELSGDVTISAADLEGVPSDWTVRLIDTRGTTDPADDTSRVLRENEAGYTFAYSSDSQTKSATTSSKTRSAKTSEAPAPPPTRLNWQPPIVSDSTSGKTATKINTRFRLRVEPKAAQLSAFSAELKNKKAVLTWATAYESSDVGFEVQHQRLPPSDSTAQPGEWTTLQYVAGGKAEKSTGTAGQYRYQTRALEYGDHAFRLRQVGTNGKSQNTETRTVSIQLDEAYSVGKPYPNPVSGQATMEVVVRRAQEVKVRIYDILGRRVATPFRERVAANTPRKVQVPGQRFSSGTYFLRVVGEDFRVTRKMVVVK